MSDAWAATTSMQRATNTVPGKSAQSPADADIQQAEENSGGTPNFAGGPGAAQGALRQAVSGS
jgi:hypothetical protein